MTRTLERLAAISLCYLFLVGCVAHQSYRCARSTTPECAEWHETGNGFSVSYIEFDDQGQFWNREQLFDATANVMGTSASAPNGSLTVVFVHGWKHSSAIGDGNVENFKEFLKRMAALEIRTGRNRPITGVYIAWRGGSVFAPEPIKSIASYFDRNAAALRVAGPATTQTIYTLARATKDVNQRSQVLLIGHSMGGLILQRTMMQGLIAELTASAIEAGVAYMTQERNKYSVPSWSPPADLIVFINPASSALYDAQFIQALRIYLGQGGAALGQNRILTDFERALQNRRRPFVLSLTSTRDRATGVVFPIAKTLDSQGSLYREFDTSSGLPNEQLLYIRPAALVPELRSHNLSVEKVSPAVALPKLCPGNGNGGEICFESGRHRFFLNELDGYNDTPYWIFPVGRDISRGHNDIFGDAMLDFLIGIIETTNAMK